MFGTVQNEKRNDHGSVCVCLSVCVCVCVSVCKRCDFNGRNEVAIKQNTLHIKQIVRHTQIRGKMLSVSAQFSIIYDLNMLFVTSILALMEWQMVSADIMPGHMFQVRELYCIFYQNAFITKNINTN